jgi:predicted RNA methylase
MNHRKGTTKSGGRKHSLDKFYTNPQTALSCIALLELEEYATIIEPAAGNGSFSLNIPSVLAFDLHPEHNSIIQQDWFQYEGTRIEGKTLVIGNPPFGQQNTLAVKFINHAATFADTIAFILPKSFMKEGVQKFLNPHLHLRQQIVLPNNSFLVNGKPAHVPCVFQIWDYDETRVRVPSSVPTYKGFQFVNKTDDPDLYIQRIGGKAGNAGVNWELRSTNSNYFIKVDKKVISISKFIKTVNKTSFPSKHLSVGPRSLSKKEIVTSLIEANPLLKT